MPYCPKCGAEVEDAHFYCGQCGYQLKEGEDDEPPIYSNDRGFLTGRSIEYLNELSAGGEVDRESPGHAQLAEDLCYGFSDLGCVAIHEDLSILDLILGMELPPGFPDVDRDGMTRREEEAVAAYTGMKQVLALYDRFLQTTWSDDFSQRFQEVTETVMENVDSDEYDIPS